MKKKRVYISGKMTGLPKWLWVARFKSAEMKLMEMGMQPINPARMQLPEEWEIDHDTYIMMDLELLNTCDAIYMLANWKTSTGARIERDWAIRKHKEIMYEEEI